MKLIELSSPRYSLEMSHEEAMILKTIAGYTRGTGRGRRFVDSLYDAMTRVSSDTKIIFDGKMEEMKDENA